MSRDRMVQWVPWSREHPTLTELREWACRIRDLPSEYVDVKSECPHGGCFGATPQDASAILFALADKYEKERMERQVHRPCYPYEPDYAVPPGQTLQETIDALGIDQKELAKRADLSLKHVNQIAKGVARIVQDTAIRLERATGVPARVWNNLEANYREQLARLEEKDLR